MEQNKFSIQPTAYDETFPLKLKSDQQYQKKYSTYHKDHSYNIAAEMNC